MPVADGGEGTVDALCSGSRQVETVDAFGRPRMARAGVLADGTRVVEAAEAIPLDPARLDVLAASSRGLGLWIAQYRDCPLVVTVGGTATMDAGAGLLEVLDRLPGPTRVLCDVATTLYDAPRLFGPQKGATPEQVVELEARFRGIDRLAPFAGSAGLRGGRRPRRRARVARRGARAGRGRSARPARLRSGALRPRRHRGGSGRRDDLGGEGARCGRRVAAPARTSAASSSAGWSRQGRSPRDCPWNWSRSAATRLGRARISSSSGRSWGAL